MTTAKFDFDHVALAAHDATPVLERLVGELGATELYGAVDRGFRWVVLHAGDAGGGMLIELLEPWSVHENPFLARFLERRGEGAHHLTLKTRDLIGTIGAVERAGYPLVDQELANPAWQEAFLRPRDAYGTIVQLVQTTIVRPPLAEMLASARGGRRGALDTLAGGTGHQVAQPWWHSPESRGPSVALRCVVFAAAHPDAAARFYEVVLGGQPVAAAVPGRIELAWPSGARLGFERWHDERGGIVALEFEPAATAPFRIGHTEIRFRSF